MLCLGLCYNIGMPNAPKTPIRTIRVSDELWTAVQAQAAEDGVTVTSIIINALRNYLFVAELDKLEE